MIVIAKRPLPSRDVPGPVDAGRKFLRERIEEVDFATSVYGLDWSAPAPPPSEPADGPRGSESLPAAGTSSGAAP